MVYGLVKLDVVIAKVLRDLGLGEDEIPYQSMIEWIGEALEHIGSFTQFTEKECNIIITDYKGYLPCDFHKMIRLKLGCSMPYTKDSDLINTEFAEAVKDVTCKQLNSYEAANFLNNWKLSKIDNPDFINTLSQNPNLIGSVSFNKITDLDYNITHNMIKTSFKQGVINCQYLAIPVDENGFPLVPDDVSFKDALFWKIAMQLSMLNPALLKNQILKDFRYCKDQWEFYCVQARANANMPGPHEMGRLKNNYMRLLNYPDSDTIEYRDLGRQQRLNFDGEHGRHK